MNDNVAWSAEELSVALHRVKLQVESERRAQFASFGVPEDCLWPCSRVFHEQSALGPAWCPTLTAEEVTALTRRLDYKRYPGAERVTLPARAPTSSTLEHTLRTRRSTREFSEQPITLAELAALLQLGAGVTEIDEIPRRAAPSGGGLYPVEVYVLAFGVEGLRPAVWHYSALDDVLEFVRPLAGLDDLREFIPSGLVAGTPQLMLALSGVFARSQLKYLERGYRFVLLEAGHIAQNFSLLAAALGLGALCVGGFWDDPFNELLGLEIDKEAVVYSIALGRRRAATR